MGYGSNCCYWFAIRDRLAREHRVIVFDNRGTGRSDKPDIPYTKDMLLGDIVGVLDAIGIERDEYFRHLHGWNAGAGVCSALSGAGN